MKILILANYGLGLYKFRKEFIENLISNNHEVYISHPYDEYAPKLMKMGANFIDTVVDRRGLNPLSDLKLFLSYLNIIGRIKPDAVLTYTIKPNIYGGLACKIRNIPYITNITGLGTSMEKEGLLQQVLTRLYKVSLKKSSCVFFQNMHNLNYFRKHKIINKNFQLIPGSGVNLQNYTFMDYPEDNKITRFLFVGRIMRAKGIEELMDAAEIIKGQFPNVYFEIVGPIEEDYLGKLGRAGDLGIVKYHGQQDDVQTYIQNTHATILPSYHEGIANVLLETAASGRPVLASQVPGCLETFDEGQSGFGFEVRNVDSLVNTITRFIGLPYTQKREMGRAARDKMEREYDRNFVIKAYTNEINKLIKEI